MVETLDATTAAPKWPVVAKTVGISHGYARAQGDMVHVDEQRVHALLAQRQHAKRNREFDKADSLRGVLLQECRVEVFDKTKFWRVVGGKGHVPLPPGESKPRAKPSKSKAVVCAAQLPPAAATVALEPPSRQGGKKLRKKQQQAATQMAETPIASGFGHAMLLKMGWDGQGSGLREGALTEPLDVLPRASKRGRRGLSAEDNVDPPAAGGQRLALAGVEAAATGSQKKKRKKRKARGGLVEDEDARKAEECVAAKVNCMVTGTESGGMPRGRVGAKLNAKRKAQLKRRAAREAAQDGTTALINIKY